MWDSLKQPLHNKRSTDANDETDIITFYNELSYLYLTHSQT